MNDNQVTRLCGARNRRCQPARPRRRRRCARAQRRINDVGQRKARVIKRELEQLKSRLLAIAAHDLGVPAERLAYADGNVSDRSAPQNNRSWI